MKGIYLFASIVLVLLTSCLRLDDNLFGGSAKDKYELDKFKGEQEIYLDSTYKIADSLIKVFPLTSDDAGNKAKIYAVYIGELRKISTDTVILYFHGTRDHIDFYWNRTKLLAHVGGKHRYGVMTIDYRGYGMSEGKPTESGLYADALAAIQWLKANGLTEDRLIVYGLSLGSAPATFRTANPEVLKPAKLILEAPFASSAVMVQDAAMLALPATYFTNLKIANSQEIKKVQQPFMWIHGTTDDFLNISTHGELIYNNYQGVYKEAHRIEGAIHNNVPFVWGYENYKTAINNFIER